MGRNNADMWKGISDFDALHGTAFRIAKTPSGQARDAKTGEVLPDDPNRTSIVTPENESAWRWESAAPDQIHNVRTNWTDFLNDEGADYKKAQIARSAKYNKAEKYDELEKLGHQFK
jgi:hypothetical protein